MKRTVRIAAVALVAVGAIAAALHRDEIAARFGAPPPFALYGNIDIRDVDLGFRVDGRLASLAVDEGDTVAAGAVLGRIDPAPFERALREAQASAAALEARVALLRAGSRREEIAQARAALEERRAAFANAETTLKRHAQLLDAGATSRQAHDDAMAARQEAAARMRSAEAAARQTEAGFRKEEVSEAEANLERAEAAVAQARLRLQDTVLHAPSAGIVLTRAVEPGAIVAAGATVLKLSLVRPVWARVYVAERDLGRFAPGTEVTLHTDAPGAPAYRGRVGFVSPTAEFTPKTVETPDLRTDLVYRARVIVLDPDPRLRQGMPVTVRLPTTDVGDAGSARADLATR